MFHKEILVQTLNGLCSPLMGVCRALLKVRACAWWCRASPQPWHHAWTTEDTQSIVPGGIISCLSYFHFFFWSLLSYLVYFKLRWRYATLSFYPNAHWREPEGRKEGSSGFELMQMLTQASLLPGGVWLWANTHLERGIHFYLEDCFRAKWENVCKRARHGWNGGPVPERESSFARCCRTPAIAVDCDLRDKDDDSVSFLCPWGQSYATYT